MGGVDNTRAVAVHPSGDYALVLEAYNDVHLIRLGDMTTTTFNLSEASETLYFFDVTFADDGNTALIVGQGRVDDAKSGVVIRVEHDAYAAAVTADPVSPVFTEAALFTRLSPPPGQSVDGVVFGWEGQYAMLFSTSNAGSATVFFRLYDPIADMWTYLGSQFISAGCDGMGGLALVDNVFGGPGIFAACGWSGRDQVYFTLVGGQPETTTNLFGSSVSNPLFVAGSPARDEALMLDIQDSATRFDNGVIDTTDARITRRGQQALAYQPNGRRALIVGNLNTDGEHLLEAIEYRPPLFGSCAISCDLTDVSVPSGSMGLVEDGRMTDIAWRHDCDGGLAVGGKSTFNSSVGYVFTFQLEGGVSCSW